VIEALGFAGGTLSQAGRDWLAGLGPVQEDTTRGWTVRCWAGPGSGCVVHRWPISLQDMPSSTRPGISRAPWARQR
jgi:hypothetical protein